MEKEQFDEGNINFFNVDMCGLYNYVYSKDPKVYDLQLADTFRLISEWASTRNGFSDTAAWQSGSKLNLADCYLHDIYHNEDTGDYFVVLWKSQSNNKGIFGAEEEAKIGNGKVFEKSNHVSGKKVVWGTPCYYWVCPEKNSVMSIKFNHSQCDSDLFQEYVSCVMRNKVKSSNRKKTHTEKSVVITFELDDHDKSLYYRFKKSLIEIDTTHEKLQSLAPTITHIVKREQVEVQSKDERTEWLKLLGQIPMMQPKSKARTRQIEIRAEVRPSVNELKQIISEAQKKDYADNLGFVSGQRTIWLDTYRLTDKVRVPGKKDQVLKAVELAEHIEKRRASYLGLIPMELELHDEENILTPSKEAKQ